MIAKKSRNSRATIGPDTCMVYGKLSILAPSAHAARFIAEEKMVPVFFGAPDGSSSPAHVRLETGERTVSSGVAALAGDVTSTAAMVVAAGLQVGWVSRLWCDGWVRR